MKMEVAEKTIIGKVTKKNGTFLEARQYLGSDHILIYNEKNHQTRIGCKKGREKQVMFRYGKSKVIHWNDKCARPNAYVVPDEVELLDSILHGLSECDNCHGRTGYVLGNIR